MIGVAGTILLLVAPMALVVVLVLYVTRRGEDETP